LRARNPPTHQPQARRRSCPSHDESKPINASRPTGEKTVAAFLIGDRRCLPAPGSTTCPAKHHRDQPTAAKSSGSPSRFSQTRKRSNPRCRSGKRSPPHLHAWIFETFHSQNTLPKPTTEAPRDQRSRKCERSQKSKPPAQQPRPRTNNTVGKKTNVRASDSFIISCSRFFGASHGYRAMTVDISISPPAAPIGTRHGAKAPFWRIEKETHGPTTTNRPGIHRRIRKRPRGRTNRCQALPQFKIHQQPITNKRVATLPPTEIAMHERCYHSRPAPQSGQLPTRYLVNMQISAIHPYCVGGYASHQKRKPRHGPNQPRRNETNEPRTPINRFPQKTGCSNSLVTIASTKSKSFPAHQKQSKKQLRDALNKPTERSTH